MAVDTTPTHKSALNVMHSTVMHLAPLSTPSTYKPRMSVSAPVLGEGSRKNGIMRSQAETYLCLAFTGKNLHTGGIHTARSLTFYFLLLALQSYSQLSILHSYSLLFTYVPCRLHSFLFPTGYLSLFVCISLYTLLSVTVTYGNSVHRCLVVNVIYINNHNLFKVVVPLNHVEGIRSLLLQSKCKCHLSLCVSKYQCDLSQVCHNGHQCPSASATHLNVQVLLSLILLSKCHLSQCRGATAP